MEQNEKKKQKHLTFERRGTWERRKSKGGERIILKPQTSAQPQKIKERKRNNKQSGSKTKKNGIKAANNKNEKNCFLGRGIAEWRKG
jgi:hypothetical protein